MAYALRTLRVLLLAAASVALGPSSASLAGSETVQLAPAERVLAQVPAAARSSFLLYQLATAINSGNYPGLALEVEREQELEQELLVEHQVDYSWPNAMPNEFQPVSLNGDFPLQFQDWLMDGYGLSVQDVYQSWPRAAAAPRSAQRQLCNGRGECYDVADILAACCPF
ncbi:uncharacterized protein LOC108650452 isoform X1 [Drosophila navojoa]|uniref:uncharacterized protein LOC108650452 isoform X1 n=1 Tax=Drosophila navojoa TaxID=7232 RepID=UPI0011BDD4CD|nr:uncharacterized protein LOC108650452 isoform X1 [Drosophila navojoa]